MESARGNPKETLRSSRGAPDRDSLGAVESSSDRYTFDGFVFDPATGELHRDGGGTRLPPKPARMLALLLERPGELVPREELVEELWPGQHLDVDQALAYTVRQVRSALEDDAGEPRFVETLPRRGYRFVGRLREDGGEIPPPASGSRPAAPARRVRVRSGPVVIALILALVAVYGWFWLGAQRELEREMAGDLAAAPGRASVGEPVRIALLPLVPPPEAATPAAVAANDRLTELLLIALAARPELELVGPATTARLRATGRPHPEVGRELDVAFVASGGFRPGPDPDGEVLFLQLVRASDGGHVFAERFRGTEPELRRRLPEAAGALAATANEDAAALGGE
jgi:DNA-binding winged helix-turn-helix (wHTH) protein/TolB-like protein